jgi:hypothetical protein
MTLYFDARIGYRYDRDKGRNQNLESPSLTERGSPRALVTPALGAGRRVFRGA